MRPTIPLTRREYLAKLLKSRGPTPVKRGSSPYLVRVARTGTVLMTQEHPAFTWVELLNDSEVDRIFQWVAK